MGLWPCSQSGCSASTPAWQPLRACSSSRVGQLEQGAYGCSATLCIQASRLHVRQCDTPIVLHKCACKLPPVLSSHTWRCALGSAPLCAPVLLSRDVGYGN